MRCLEWTNSETERRTVIHKDLGEGEMGSYCLMGTDFQFGKMKVLDMNMMMVIQQWDTLSHSLGWLLSKK